jgi:homoserine O-acetyltransferase
VQDNVILPHTGLSASSHAASTHENPAPGWWEIFIGLGRALDTRRFFIICTNVLGGCYGSTGPSSIDPAIGKPYATSFPVINIFDMVKAQYALLDHLGIGKLYASVGSSMGVMQLDGCSPGGASVKLSALVELPVAAHQVSP